MSTDMSVKTVTLSEDAYVALASLKREGESFSDVVRRITRKNRSLLDFAGDWKDVPADVMRGYVQFLETGERLSRNKLRRVARRADG